MTRAERIARLEARLAREQATREEAERLAEQATRELYVTREHVRLLSGVAVAANEAEDLDSALLAAMHALCAHTGWPAARAELLGPDGAAAGRLRCGELLPGSTRVFELPIALRSGRPAGRLEFFSPLPSPAGGVLLDVAGHVGRQLGRVADRVAAEQALRDALGELERSNGELEAFAYAASHDLREPLRTIGGFAELLARRCSGRLDGDAEVFLDYIVDGVARLQALVDDLLALARAGREEGRRDVVDLAEVAQATVRALEPAITEAGARVEVGPLPEVVGDAGQLGQVLANLVANALKFHGGRPPRVALGAKRRRDAWLVTVTDRGPGIPPDQRERVFEMFHRAPAGTGTPGSGLGLAICRRIVEHHGGRIWVQEAPGGRGARFCVLLADREPATARPAAPAPAPRGGGAGAGAA